VWAISNRQGLSTGQYNTGRGNPGSSFDLLFAQFATIEPDPVARAQLVNSFQRANGINPSSSLNNGFLPSQVQLERRREASVAWLGMRSTMIFNVYQTQSQPVEATNSLNPNDPLQGPSTLTWLGAGANWSHRLTPSATVSLSATGQRTTQLDGRLETTLWVGTAIWTNQIDRRTNVSLSARHQAQTGTSSYNESALLATLNMTF
jgi:uncharacterized protein (PEP-CTERM system associated)